MLDIILATATGVGLMTLYIMEISVVGSYYIFIRDGIILHRLDLFFRNALNVYLQFSCCIDLVKFGQRWPYLTSDMMEVLIVFMYI